jgi:hypothetical protein
MNILFYFGHPAQYLFLRATIKELIKLPGHGVIITIKSKDVLEELIKSDNLPYINIQQTERGNSKFSIVLNLLKRTLKLFRLALTYKPDLMIGTDATIAQIGFLLNIHRITITEDDYDVINPPLLKVDVEEEEELFEIEIDDVTYCTNNDESGFIYQLSEDGDVGEKVGYFKDSEPFFYADE